MSAALPALREALRMLYGPAHDPASRRAADAFLQGFTHHEDAWEASLQLLLVGEPGEQARRLRRSAWRLACAVCAGV